MDKIAVLIPCYNEALTVQKVVTDFRRALPEAMEKYGIKNLKDIIGGIQEWEKM